MVIKVKNRKLRAKVFKRMRDLDKKAIKAYRDGDIFNGKKYERMSDKVYKQNYWKMFMNV